MIDLLRKYNKVPRINTFTDACILRRVCPDGYTYVVKFQGVMHQNEHLNLHTWPNLANVTGTRIVLLWLACLFQHMVAQPVPWGLKIKVDTSTEGPS